MKIISWNVNGIRAAYKKGFVEFVERENPDILCLQESKAHREQCEPILHAPGGRVSHWSSALKKGYSGTVTYTRTEPPDVARGIGIPEYDSEGRFVITKTDQFTIYNIYFPNGGSGLDRHNFKQKFLVDLGRHLQAKIAVGEKIIVVGDYNIAHREIDIYDPVRNAGESGFLPEERAWFDQFLEMGFVDTFRHLHPNERERFTWWSYLERGRVNNRGWRIDYICVTENLLPFLTRARILDEQEGSDHCPVLAEFKF